MNENDSECWKCKCLKNVLSCGLLSMTWVFRTLHPSLFMWVHAITEMRYNSSSFILKKPHTFTLTLVAFQTQRNLQMYAKLTAMSPVTTCVCLCVKRGQQTQQWGTFSNGRKPWMQNQPYSNKLPPHTQIS